MEKNPLEIPCKGTTLERAIINVLNRITRDMYDKNGQVKFIEKTIEENKVIAKTDVTKEEESRKEDVIELCNMIIDIVGE